MASASSDQLQSLARYLLEASEQQKRVERLEDVALHVTRELAVLEENAQQFEAVVARGNLLSLERNKLQSTCVNTAGKLTGAAQSLRKDLTSLRSQALELPAVGRECLAKVNRVLEFLMNESQAAEMQHRTKLEQMQKEQSNMRIQVRDCEARAVRAESDVTQAKKQKTALAAKLLELDQKSKNQDATFQGYISSVIKHGMNCADVWSSTRQIKFEISALAKETVCHLAEGKTFFGQLSRTLAQAVSDLETTHKEQIARLRSALQQDNELLRQRATQTNVQMKTLIAEQSAKIQAASDSATSFERELKREQQRNKEISVQLHDREKRKMDLRESKIIEQLKFELDQAQEKCSLLETRESQLVDRLTSELKLRKAFEAKHGNALDIARAKIEEAGRAAAHRVDTEIGRHTQRSQQLEARIDELEHQIIEQKRLIAQVEDNAASARNGALHLRDLLMSRTEELSRLTKAMSEVANRAHRHGRTVGVAF